MFKRSAVFAVFLLVLAATPALADVEVIVLEESDQGLYGAVLRAGGNANIIPLVMDDNGITKSGLTKLIPGREIAIQKRYLEPDFKPSRAILARARAIFSDEAVANAAEVVPEKITASPAGQHERVVVQATPSIRETTVAAPIPTTIPPASVNPPVVSEKTSEPRAVAPEFPRQRIQTPIRLRRDPPVENNQGAMLVMFSIVLGVAVGFVIFMALQDSVPMLIRVVRKLGIIPLTATVTVAEKEAELTLT